jgi:dihydropteroate synthase
MPFATRPPFDWRLRTRTLALGPRTLLMGILNVTPDSFSDGGQHLAPPAALDQALRLLDEGADILDLGGESTRPNASPLTLEEEQSRTLPVLTAIFKARPETIISIDTYHASTARLAIEAGAEIVNDVSGHTWDAAMSATCADLRCGALLMHAHNRPNDWANQPPLAPDAVLSLVLGGLRHSIALAEAAGIPRAQIVLDPGFGFGKLGNANYTLLAHFEQLQQLGLPLLAGTSRKGFLGKTLAALNHGQPVPSHARQNGTLASSVAAILAGAHILRIHEVRAAAEAAAIADAILAAG